MFALGCILFYALSRGAHPFGPRASREANILAGRPNLDKLREQKEEIACHLAGLLVQYEAAARPTAAAAVRHGPPL